MHHKLQNFPPKNDVQNTVALGRAIRCSRLLRFATECEVVGDRHHYSSQNRASRFHPLLAVEKAQNNMLPGHWLRTRQGLGIRLVLCLWLMNTRMFST